MDRMVTISYSCCSGIYGQGKDSSTQYCIIGRIGNTEESDKMIGLVH